jgi:hypothetical protein
MSKPLPRRIKPDLTDIRTEELFAEINRRLADAAGEPETAKGYTAERPQLMPEAWAADHSDLWGQLAGEIEVTCRYAAECHRHGQAGYGAGLVENALTRVIFHAQRAQVILPRLLKIEDAARREESKRMLAEFRQLESQYRTNSGGRGML